MSRFFVFGWVTVTGVFQAKSGLAQASLAAADLACGCSGVLVLAVCAQLVMPDEAARAVQASSAGGWTAFVLSSLLLLMWGHYRSRLAEGCGGGRSAGYWAATVGAPVAAQLLAALTPVRANASLVAGGAVIAWSVLYWQLASPILQRAVLRGLRCWGCRDRVLVVSSGDDEACVRERLLEPFSALLEPVGWHRLGLSSAVRGNEDAVESLDRLCGPQIGEFLVSHAVSCALVAAPEGVDVADLDGACASVGVRVLSVDVAELAATRNGAGAVRGWGNGPKAEREAVRRFLALRVKDACDFLIALAVICVALPLFILIGIAVRMASPGPALFHQERTGWHGRVFTMLKFRSMRSDAGGPPAAASTSEPGDILLKPRDDPRVTGLGRLLRRSSLDELPQLWNVLRGEMSLVGPRPMPLYETARFTKLCQHRRTSMKPGLTGLWQVSGRSNIRTMNERIALDLEYVDKWSLASDVRLLLATVPAVLTARGAQ